MVIEVLGKERRAGLAAKGDDLVNAGIFEPIDGPAMQLVLKLIDEGLLVKVPENFHDDIREVVDAVLAGDKKALQVEVVQALQEAAGMALTHLLEKLADQSGN